MKKTVLTILFMMSIMFLFNYQSVSAADVVEKEEFAEVTDINDILDDIEVISVEEYADKAKAATEDYRGWTQDDSRWGTIELGKSGNTMKRSGCLVTSITKLVIQSELKKSSEFTPKTMVTWLNKNGGFTDGGGLYWGKPAEYVSGLTYIGDITERGTYDSKTCDNKFINWINQGYHLVVQVKDGGHWVAVDEAQTLKNGVVYMMDSIPSNVNVDITLAERYPTYNRVVAYSGGITPEVIPDVPVLRAENTPENKNNSNVILNWTKAAGYTEGYLIERSEDAGETWQVVKEINEGQTVTWTDKSTEAESAYQYRLYPLNENNETGPCSNTVEITTKHVHDYKRTVQKKASFDEAGKLKNVCKTCGFEKITTIYRLNDVKLGAEKFTYNGKVKEPKVTVTNKNGGVVDSSYYTITYDNGRKLVGTYKVTVKFKGRYKGTVTKTFKIYPKKTNITKLTGGKKSFTVKWEKVDKQISGYEIHFTPIKTPSDNYKIEKVSKNKLSSKINVVRACSNYYVKIRTYKIVDGVTYRSGWSEVKTVKTK